MMSTVVTGRGTEFRVTGIRHGPQTLCVRRICCRRHGDPQLADPARARYRALERIRAGAHLGSASIAVQKTELV
jgi:hypothetical protein